MKTKLFLLISLFVVFLITPTSVMLLDHSSDVTLIYKIAEEEKSEKNTPSNSFTEEEFTNDVQHQFLFLAPAEAKQVNTTYQLKLQSAYIDISPPPPDVIS